jgi:putative membrane protein
MALLSPYLAAAALLPVADTWGMHDDDIGTGWMVVMMLGMVIFWGLVILGVIWLVREFGTPHRRGGGDEPLAILDRRLAEGDISIREYEARRRKLAG